MAMIAFSESRIRRVVLGGPLAMLLAGARLGGQTHDAVEGNARRTIQISGWLESELRFFSAEGLYARQRRAYPALGSELRAAGALGSGVFRWNVIGFARV